MRIGLTDQSDYSICILNVQTFQLVSTDKEQTNEQTKRTDQQTDKEQIKNEQRTVHQTMNRVSNNEETHS